MSYCSRRPAYTSDIPFYFHITAPTALYTLSLHDALPISPARALRDRARHREGAGLDRAEEGGQPAEAIDDVTKPRSEEHTSELQSHSDLVCRLLLEKKKGAIGSGSRRCRGRCRGGCGRRQ